MDPSSTWSFENSPNEAFGCGLAELGKQVGSLINGVYYGPKQWIVM